MTTTTYNTSKTQDTIRHDLNDAALGGLGPYGTVNYAGKSLNVRLVSLDSTTGGYKSDYENASVFENEGAGGSDSRKGGSYQDVAVSEEILAASTLEIRYAIDFATPITVTESFTPEACSIDLCPYTSDYVVPGSVQFTWMGHVYEDYDGVIVRDRTPSSPGTVSGIMRYAEGIAELTDYVVDPNPNDFVLNSLWTTRKNWTTASVFLRTQASPIKPTGFVMNLSDTAGNAITATGDTAGLIAGTHLRGNIDYDTGVVELQFGDYVLDTTLTPAQKLEWWYSADDVGAVQALKIWRPWPVDPTTLRYNSVAYFYLPIDADQLGLDPVRLPPDGRVPVFRRGGFAVVGHTGRTPAATATNGQVINCARTRLSRLRVVGSDGLTINTGYTADLDAGTVTYVDVSTWQQPVHVEHRIEDLAKVADVQIDGTIGFTRQLSHDFPLGSYVSSALMAGTLKSRVSKLFDQQTWDKLTWSDSLVGNAAPATYNDTLAPIEVTNAGALTERWALVFNTTTTFDLIGEHVGFIATGSINTDLSPINPIAGAPYFTMRALGFGVGWAAGNVIFIHTVGAMVPFAAIRTVQQGSPAGIDYNFTLLGRGDVDRP